MHASLKVEVAGREKDVSVLCLPRYLCSYPCCLSWLKSISKSIRRLAKSPSVRPFLLANSITFLLFIKLDDTLEDEHRKNPIRFSYAIVQIFYPTINRYVKFHLIVTNVTSLWYVRLIRTWQRYVSMYLYPRLTSWTQTTKSARSRETFSRNERGGIIDGIVDDGALWKTQIPSVRWCESKRKEINSRHGRRFNEENTTWDIR